MSETDQQLVTIASTPIHSIADVVAVFEAIENAVPESDGLHWFNWLYLTVTKSVGASMGTLQWNNPSWLERLDIIFAGLYLKGLRKCLREDADAPRCWQVFVNARHNTRLARIQFAMAGMNAHINHDLCEAVVLTCRELGLSPTHESDIHADFTQVNSLLDDLIDTAKKELRVGLLGDVLPTVDALEDRLAGVGILASRELAWTNAELVWHAQILPGLGDRFLKNLDRTTALVGRGLLIPV